VFEVLPFDVQAKKWLKKKLTAYQIFFFLNKKQNKLTQNNDKVNGIDLTLLKVLLKKI
jgi:hypothetical protein